MKLKKACIIDDDRIYVFGLRKIMEINNFSDEIVVFPNGKEALDYLKSLLDKPESLPDVILLDLNMPVMDGWQFLDEFIKIKNDLPKKITIYIMSSSIYKDDLERAKSYSEVTDYFVKPVKVKDLEQIIKNEQ